MKAAIYTRVSTTDQVDGTSLEEQRRMCEAAVAAHAWEVAEVYSDRGASGTSHDRPEWQRMLADCRSGRVQAVVVAKLDRFARKAADAITETDRFGDLGVTLVVVKEQIDMSTPAGRMMRTMLAGIAEMERDLIVDRTTSGQRAKARNGEWPGGQPPFGWRLEGKSRDARPVPDERERRVLATAYELLVRKRLTAGQVADRLNDAGLFPRLAPRWNFDVLRRTLVNPTLYTGQTVWGGTAAGSIYKRSHHTRLKHDGTPMYGDPIPVHVPDPPFSKAQHQAVMRAFARRSTRGQSQASVTQMLSIRLYGECGKPYLGVTLSAKDYDVYRCTGRRHTAGPAKCSCQQVQVQALDARVWAEVEQLLGDPERLEAMARLWLAVPDDTSEDDAAQQVAGIAQQIDKRLRARVRAAEELLLADDPEPIRAALHKVEGELVELQQRKAAYAALVASDAERAERLTDLVQLAHRARGRLATMSREQRREVIEILGIEVTMAGPIHKSKPESITITGHIDPRMFAEKPAAGVPG
ncbi:recombinase family protein [Curtobacterium sp. NPDC089991]|uniref:recombinase family protein n=1 Tax=Curtobacterium sp. NPDC089991 TaxID=3363969 RepID=UPI0038208D3B